MTESAIIAAFMVIQFACIWAAVSFQKAKIGVMDEARLAAWQTAIQYWVASALPLRGLWRGEPVSTGGP